MYIVLWVSSKLSLYNNVYKISISPTPSLSHSDSNVSSLNFTVGFETRFKIERGPTSISGVSFHHTNHSGIITFVSTPVS